MAPSDKTDGAETPKTNWAKVFSEFACHTNITRAELFDMPLPIIQAYLRELPENIALKIGMPGLLGGTLDNPPLSPTAGKAPKLSEFMSFANAFNGI